MLDSGSTAEAVCADDPELLPVVKDRWKAFKLHEAEVEAMFPASSAFPGNRRAASSQADDPPAIPGYDVSGLLGCGGMGVVYRARHIKLNRNVAIKMLLTGVYATPTEVARFLREAKLVAGLRHPNLVQVHDVGESAGCPYFTMELVEGGSLAQLLAGIPQSPPQAAKMVATLAIAVQAAHDGGIVHRDLKPSNILLTAQGVPKISDFGLARRVEDDVDLTLSGARIGTPSYMAPEQFTNRAGEVGPLSDIYSLGAILYEMLTGRPPFRADTAADTERQVISDEPVSPSRLNSKVPRDLETICLKCLQKEPHRRYATAVLLAEDLGRFLDGKPIAARPVGPIMGTIKWVRRKPTQATLLLVATVLLLGLASGSLWLLSERSARTHTVESDLQKVISLENEARWDEARTVLARSRIELGNHGPQHLHRQLDERNHELDLVSQLSALQFNELDVAQNRAARIRDDYRTAFKDLGIDAFGADKVAAISRIKESPIRRALLETLDEWLIMVTDLDQRNWLLEVAQASDEDQSAWRRLARDPAVWDNKSRFDAVITSIPKFQRSVSLLYALAWHGLVFHEDPVALLTAIQEIFPADLRVNLLLGYAFTKSGNSPQALRYLEAAVACQPHEAIAESNLGIVLYQAGRKQESIVHFRNAIALQPAIPEPYYNLGHTLQDLGRYPEAVEQFRLMTKYAPYVAISYLAMGHCFDAMGQQTEAIHAYQLALFRDPTLVIPGYKTRPQMTGIQVWEHGSSGWDNVRNSGPHTVVFWCQYLELSLFLGHEEDYRQARTRNLAQFADEDSAGFADDVGRTSLLLPASEKETLTAVALIDRAVKDKSMIDSPAANACLVDKALADVRQGHPQDAANILTGKRMSVRQPMPQLILALAQVQLGKTDDARKTLASAITLFDWSRDRATDSDAWTFHILRREAEHMLAATPNPAP